ncbi:MAG TPA: endonuclease III [Candidatus Polarisedimenticolia bacterium]|nr:endonuclease III [Candidatus Polarisedimenticolia bacterium]
MKAARRAPPPRGVGRALDRLEAAFGRPRPERRLDPLDELILTVLSQNTNDRNRDRAYVELRRRLPTWARAHRAGPGAIEEAIRTGGLARTKSRVIHGILERVRGDRGHLSLGHLRRMPPSEARRYLAGFKGVGDKTICCVLLFSCGHPAFPVDTHIHRVARRLGWVPAHATVGRSHVILAEVIPPRRYYTAHVNLITLGRRLCRPRRPACPTCPLRGGCRYGQRATILRRRPSGPSVHPRQVRS